MIFKKDRIVVSSLPYISSPGNIEKALKGIQAASVPPTVSQDFVKTVLKIPGGSGDQITTFLKKLNLAGTNGKPTEAYIKFRNPTTSGQIMAAAIKQAYARLYVRNEYMHDLSDEDLQGLIVEETGQARDVLSVKRTLASIITLKKFADFGKVAEIQTEPIEDLSSETSRESSNTIKTAGTQQSSEGIKLNLGYTINLNLPASSDPAVFNAIFKSLKEHLLRDSDA